MIYYRPRISFSASFCITFLQSETRSAINQLLPTPESVRGFCQFLDMFYQEALPVFRFVSRVHSLLTTGDRHWRKLAATLKKAKSAIHLHLHSNGVAFHVGCLFSVCMVTGWPFMWDAYFPSARKNRVAFHVGWLFLYGCL